MTSQVLASRIRDVVVFRQGAVVTREVEAPEGAWPEEVVIDGLPLTLEDGSLRVKLQPVATGDGGQGEGEDKGEADEAPVLPPQPSDARVELRVPQLGESLEPPSDEAVREAEEELARLEFLAGRLDEVDGLYKRLRLALPERIEREPPRPVSGTVWREITAWVLRAREAIAAQRQDFGHQARSARQQRDRLLRQREEARAQRGVDEEKVCKQVRVRLRGGDSGAPGTLLIEYRVPGARWRPGYELRVARDGSSATLGMRAMLCQNSGEAWERVRLAVSTADLQRRVKLPELKALRIGRHQPEPGHKAWREPPEDTERLFEGFDAALAGLPPPPDPDLDGEEVTEPEGLRQRLATPVAMPMAGAAAEIMDELLEEPEEDYDEEFDKEMDDVFDEDYPSGADVMYDAPAEMAQSEEMAPPAPSMSAPAPRMKMSRSMAPAGKMAKRRRAPQASKKASMLSFGSGMAPEAELDEMDAIGGGGGEALSIQQLTIKETLIDYTELRLVRWDDPQHARGSLRPSSLRDRLEGLDSGQLSQVRNLLRRASQRAGSLASFGPTTVDVSDSSGAYDHRYDATGLVDVPGDGQVHSVPMISREARVQMTLVLVPRESDQAVRVASLNNPLHAPVLAGPAEVYLDREFLVDTQLETVPAGGELQVGLGVEEALKVARNARFDESTEGLLRGGLALQHEVEIEVASRLGTAARIEVRERLPVIQQDDKEVEVKLGEVEPAWEDWTQSNANRLRGGKRWRFELAAGETRSLRYRYAVHIDA